MVPNIVGMPRPAGSFGMTQVPCHLGQVGKFSRWIATYPPTTGPFDTDAPTAGGLGPSIWWCA